MNKPTYSRVCQVYFWTHLHTLTWGQLKHYDKLNDQFGGLFSLEEPSAIANRYMRDYRSNIRTPQNANDMAGYRYANAQDMGDFLDYFFANIYPKW